MLAGKPLASKARELANAGTVSPASDAAGDAAAPATPPAVKERPTRKAGIFSRKAVDEQ